MVKNFNRSHPYIFKHLPLFLVVTGRKEEHINFSFFWNLNLKYFNVIFLIASPFLICDVKFDAFSRFPAKKSWIESPRSSFVRVKELWAGYPGSVPECKMVFFLFELHIAFRFYHWNDGFYCFQFHFFQKFQWHCLF